MSKGTHFQIGRDATISFDGLEIPFNKDAKGNPKPGSMSIQTDIKPLYKIVRNNTDWSKEVSSKFASRTSVHMYSQVMTYEGV